MTEYTIGTQQDLMTALAQAKGGDVIKVLPGTYQSVTLSNLSFDSAVQITSADPNNRAVFQDKLFLHNVENVHLDNLEFSMSALPDTGANSSYHAMLYIAGSKGISLTNSKIEGMIADRSQGDLAHNRLIEGYAAGYGIYARSSEDLLFEYNEISTAYQGMGLNDVTNTTIARNYIHDLRVDGITGFDMINTVIEENLFANLQPYQVNPDVVNGYTDDHADFIQYFGTGSKFGIDGFYVRDNVFVQEEGQTQTIFGRPNLIGTEGEDVRFTDFEMSGNLIYNGHLAGVALSGVEGAKVFNNTLLPNKEVLDAIWKAPTINISHDGVGASHADFDLNDTDVLWTQDVDIHSNVGMKTYIEYLIKAYRYGDDNLDEVKAALDIRDWGNSWGAASEITDENFLERVKFAADFDEDRVVLKIDPSSEAIHNGVGSDYYFDADKLGTFLDNLNLSIDVAVEVTSFASGASAGSVENESNVEPAEPVVEASVVEEASAEPEAVAPVEQVEAPKTLVEAPVILPQAEPVVQAPVVTPQAEPVAQAPVVMPQAEPVAQAPVVMPQAEPAAQAPATRSPEPVQAEPVEMATQPEPPAHNDQMVMILNGNTAEYDIYLEQDGTFTVTDLRTGIKDEAGKIDAIFFQGDSRYYEIDSATGETQLLDPANNRADYHKLMKIGNHLNAQDDMIETQLGLEDGPGELLLAEQGVDFISGTSGKDIILGQNCDAAILGDNGVDTIVMSGRAEQYVHHVRDGMHSLFSARTGEITEFADIEQIYFRESDTLHFVGDETALPRMSKDAFSAEYARIQETLWEYEAAHGEIG